MLRLMLIAGILCAALPAFAQSFTAEQRAACKDDYDAYCKGCRAVAACWPASASTKTGFRFLARKSSTRKRNEHVSR